MVTPMQGGEWGDYADDWEDVGAFGDVGPAATQGSGRRMGPTETTAIVICCPSCGEAATIRPLKRRKSLGVCEWGCDCGRVWRLPVEFGRIRVYLAE